MRRNIKLIIEYDGTLFNGWQMQPNGRSVQHEISRAIEKVTKCKQVKLFGSGRTDSGVHAYGQVANFITESTIPSEKFSFAINTHLPHDVSIISSHEVSYDFNARFNAKNKTYKYIIDNCPNYSPIKRNYCWNIKDYLSIEQMIIASKYLEGQHDFVSFCSSKTDIKTTVRTIHSIIIQKTGDQIEISVCGNGFLYNMVRIIVGTLIDFGRNKFHPDHMINIINSKNRSMAGKTAPSKGLYLQSVIY